ncbi:MAG: NfeD family protein [Candidatus Woesearchaeota archaeon]
MGAEFLEIFTEMGVLPIVFITIGIVLILIETLIPGFGLFGMTGVLMSVLGIIFRVIQGASFLQVIIMVLTIVLIWVLLFIVFVNSAKHGLLTRIGLVETGVVVSQKDNNTQNQQLEELVGKQGKVITACKPIGKVMVDELYYQVLSEDGYLPKGTMIEISKIDGSNIIVKKKVQKSRKIEQRNAHERGEK